MTNSYIIKYITLQYNKLSTVHNITVNYHIVLNNSVQYYTLHYYTVKYNTVHHDAVQYYTVH